MTKYEVTSKFHIKETGKPIGKYRSEIIDTKKNETFKEATSAEDIKKIYEEFWDLNHYYIKVKKIQSLEDLTQLIFDNI